MTNNKCPECGCTLTPEMINANMCWECGKILDESFLDPETLEEITEQAQTINPFSKKEVREHCLTTGFTFENRQIIEYLGLVSGETVIGTGFISDFKASFSDLFGTESKAYSDRLKDAKQAALYDMITDSINRGGNAIIGISYSYVAFTGNMIGISVNGTSVKIE